MYNKNKLRRFLPGGINDGGGWDFPSGTFRPFDLGTGFANNIGSNTNGYPNTRQGMQDQIFAAGLGLGNPPSALPQPNRNKPSNSFANITTGGNASYADLDPETGKTVDAYGNEFENWEPKKEPEEEEEDSDLIVEENKYKKKRSFDGEVFNNVFNMGVRTAVNYFNPDNMKRCGPGTRWNNETKSCMPLEVQEMMSVTSNIDQGDQQDFGSDIGFRTPEQGNDRNSRSTFGNFATSSARYGGFLKNGGTNSHKIGDEVVMSIPELEAFLAAGGEVDYI